MSGPLISRPEVRTHRLTPDDEFMVLGTDGLWDVFSSQRCIEVARMLLQESNDPQRCAEGLVSRALDMHTTDNVSVQVVCFGPEPPPVRRPSLFARSLSVESTRGSAWPLAMPEQRRCEEASRPHWVLPAPPKTPTR
uniref:Protein phosphatase 2c n=1 Tax=Tetraselmis sp. GSL018 TaxID=582737 RepID=A0A061QZ23_9CHLO